MDIEPIHNDEDHKKALGQIAKLWDAKNGTAAARKLEVLITLIEAYEAKHHPIASPTR